MFWNRPPELSGGHLDAIHPISSPTASRQRQACISCLQICWAFRVGQPGPAPGTHGLPGHHGGEAIGCGAAVCAVAKINDLDMPIVGLRRLRSGSLGPHADHHPRRNIIASLLLEVAVKRKRHARFWRVWWFVRGSSTIGCSPSAACLVNMPVGGYAFGSSCLSTISKSKASAALCKCQ